MKIMKNSSKRKKNIKKIREIVFEMTRKVLHFKTGYSTV